MSGLLEIDRKRESKNKNGVHLTSSLDLIPTQTCIEVMQFLSCQQPITIFHMYKYDTFHHQFSEASKQKLQ